MWSSEQISETLPRVSETRVLQRSSLWVLQETRKRNQICGCQRWRQRWSGEWDLFAEWLKELSGENINGLISFAVLVKACFTELKEELNDLSYFSISSS
ncbi:rCG24602 [Rattus norvegicus]|uniref:RCG24602 n=1 Tax=Rattus norvegicus TaxID=10116 RepID=A6JBR4_RAT|nr:rCG24602 [Rattus norvegicus]